MENERDYLRDQLSTCNAAKNLLQEQQQIPQQYKQQQQQRQPLQQGGSTEDFKSLENKIDRYIQNNPLSKCPDCTCDALTRDETLLMNSVNENMDKFARSILASDDLKKMVSKLQGSLSLWNKLDIFLNERKEVVEMQDTTCLNECMRRKCPPLDLSNCPVHPPCPPCPKCPEGRACHACPQCPSCPPPVCHCVTGTSQRNDDDFKEQEEEEEEHLYKQPEEEEEERKKEIEQTKSELKSNKKALKRLLWLSLNNSALWNGNNHHHFY